MEPHWEGHNMRYVAWISAELRRRGYKVRLATSPGFASHPLYADMRGDSDSGIVPLNGGGRPINRMLGYKFYYHRMFSALHRRLEREHSLPDYFLVPYLDYVAHASGVLGSPFGDKPWGGILIDPDFHLPRVGISAPDTLVRRIEERLFLSLLGIKTLGLVFTLDELLVEYVREETPELSGKVRFLMEPTSLAGGQRRAGARDALKLTHPEVVLLVYGVMDRSKGLDALIESSRQDDFPENVTLLIAGPQDRKTKSILTSASAERLRKKGRLREIDRFLQGPDERDVFLASDMVWLGYRRQYISSGVLLQAGLAGLPIVACKEGLIGWLTDNHDLGITVNVDDPTEVSHALSRLAADASLASKLGENGRLNSGKHTVERFSHAFGKEFSGRFPSDF